LWRFLFFLFFSFSLFRCLFDRNGQYTAFQGGGQRTPKPHPVTFQKIGQTDGGMDFFDIRFGFFP
jgi:hypothetical protein